MNDDTTNTTASEHVNYDTLEKKLKTFSLLTLPYNGKQRNLFNRFLIIGYESKFISKITPTIIEQCKNNPQRYSNGYKMEHLPSVINSISFDYSQEYLDDDIVIELIFPDFPDVFYIQNQHEKNINLGTSGIVFSLTPQDNNNSKKSCIGFAYLFYENEKHSKTNSIIAFPKVFCYLSEYPYFSAFYNISKKLHRLFQMDSLTFPIEAVIYNLITFTPSPLNFSMDLALWKVSVSSPMDKEYSALRYNINSSSLLDNSSLNKKQNNATRLSLNDDNYIYFPQISGYPLMHFNLPLLFNIFPVNLIIQVFLFTFFEIDILFYSGNLELLNLLMYIFSNLNYPCNDSIYFWHVLSVSIKSFMNSTGSFTGKTSSTIIGINQEYDPRVKTTLRIKEHFILDIDKKEFTYVTNTNSPESIKIKILFEGINNIMNNSLSVNGGELTESIKQLYLSLNDLAKKLIPLNKMNNKSIHSNIDLFKYDEHIAKHNRSIQNLFYSFILSVFKIYYEKYKISKNDEEDSKTFLSMYSNANKVIRSHNKLNNDNKSAFYMEFQIESAENNEFEAMFYNVFKESSKFNTYLINFMLFYDSLDLFKIPLLFTEEFISRKIISSKQIKTSGKYNYLDIIDNLYYIKSNDDIEKIGTSKRDVTKPFHKIINFNDFYFFAENNLRNDFLRRQRTDLNYFELWLVGQIVKAKYKKCELDQQYIIDYAYLINNLDDDQIIQIFPMTMYLNENICIKETKQKMISDIIERNIIKQKGFEKIDLIIFAIFSVFTLTRNINVNENAIYEVNLLINLAPFTKYNLRKYFLNLLRIYQLLYLKAYKDGNKDNEMKIYAKCFNMIRRYIYENNILPNEEFMSLISSEIIPYEQIKFINNTSNTINTIKFEYVGVNLRNEKEVKEHEKKIWIYTDNIGICSEICLEVERDESFNKYSKRSIDSNDSSGKGTPLEIDCIVNKEQSTKNKRTRFYSVLKVFKELDKLVNKFTNTLELNEYDRKKLIIIILNLVYYLYLIKNIVPDLRMKDKQENEYRGFPFEIQNTLLSYYIYLSNCENKDMSDDTNGHSSENEKIILNYKDDLDYY